MVKDFTGFVPIRLCCGQPHLTVECPDGMVMCCMCFNRFTQDQLNVTPEGPENVCLECAEQERKMITKEEK